MSLPVLLEARGVIHRYGTRETLRGFDLSLRAGEIGCLLGPSGCGKTTALRCIAGFERVGGGEIRLQDRVVASAGVNVAPEKRRVGLMFQDLALFPHCTVAENIGFGLHGLSARERRKRVEFLLSVTHLSECRDRHPHELSGGQQQRVALARALAPEPELILLDEPFSNLDPELRERLKREVRRILKECHATALLVTHDQDEAFDVADRIAVMSEGRVDQFGPAFEIYHEPRTRFVANFIGRGLFLPGVVKSADEIETELGSLRGNLPSDLRGEGAAVDVFLRPDDLIHDDSSPLSAEVVEKTFRGLYHLYLLRTGSGRLVQCLAPSHHDHPIGSRIGVRLEVDHLVVFAQAGVTPPLAAAEHTSGS